MYLAFISLILLSHAQRSCVAEGSTSLIKRASNTPTSGSASSSSLHPDLARLHSYWNQHNEWLEELNRQYPFSWDDMWLCPQPSAAAAPTEHQASGSGNHDQQQDYRRLRQLSQQLSSRHPSPRAQHEQDEHEEDARQQRQRALLLQEGQTQVSLQQHEEYARSMQQQLQERQMPLYVMQQYQHEQHGQSTERRLHQRQRQMQSGSQQSLTTTQRRTLSHHLAALPGLRILESMPHPQPQRQRQHGDDQLSQEIVREIQKQLRERRGLQQASTSTAAFDMRYHHFPSKCTSTVAGPMGEASGSSSSREHQMGSGSGLSAINWPRDALSKVGYDRAAAIFKGQVLGQLRSTNDHKFQLTVEEKYFVGDAGEMLFRALACRFRREKYNERRRNEQRSERRRIQASRQQQTPPEDDQGLSDDGNDDDGEDDDNDNDDDDHHEEATRQPRSDYERSCRRLRLKLQSVERRSDGTLFTRQDLAAVLALVSMGDFGKRRIKTIKTILLAFLRLSSHIRQDWERNVLAQYYDDYAHDRPDLSDAALAPIYRWLDEHQHSIA